jgi:uncharacterized protein DUF4160
MPEICRFYGIVIKMYFADHAPPHFHAEYAEHEARIAIDSLAVISGKLPGPSDGARCGVGDAPPAGTVGVVGESESPGATSPHRPIAVMRGRRHNPALHPTPAASLARRSRRG